MRENVVSKEKELDGAARLAIAFREIIEAKMVKEGIPFADLLKPDGTDDTTGDIKKIVKAAQTESSLPFNGSGPIPREAALALVSAIPAYIAMAQKKELPVIAGTPIPEELLDLPETRKILEQELPDIFTPE